jgi:hypothetical protein
VVGASSATQSAPLQQHKMNKKSHKVEPDHEGDDWWAWVVIGVIIGAATLALYGPLIWQATHG